MLTRTQKENLLQCARQAVISQLSQSPQASSGDENPFQNEQKISGVFVSLYVDSKLRGCIGTIDSDQPDLPSLVSRIAKAAAFSDRRFEALRVEEIDDIEIEISVLSPLEPIAEIQDIHIGRHGLMIILEERHGLLLPQVAERRNWDIQCFLQHLCRKANLPENAWENPDAKIYRFTAEIFSDRPIDESQ